MDNLVLYRQENNDLKITYYKKLGINALLIDPFSSIDEARLADIFLKNELLAKNAIRLFVSIDLYEITKKLLGQNIDLDWKNPKIRKAFYQFANYLKKHGLKGFYLKNFERIMADNTKFYIRELTKNVFLGSDVLSIGEISSNDVAYQKFLSNRDYKNFTYIYNEKILSHAFENLKEAKACFSRSYEAGIRNIYPTGAFPKNFTNMENFSYLSKTLLAGTSFFLKAGIMLDQYEEIGIFDNRSYSNDHKVLDQSKKTLDFYKKLIRIKNQSEPIKKGTYRLIFQKDPDFFAYIRSYEDEKVVVFANFSQKEVLADIRFHFIDIKDFSYYLGNYGPRKIVKNLLLRPCEFIAFVK